MIQCKCITNIGGKNMCLLHYNKKEKNIKVTKSKRFNKPSKNVDTYIYIYIYTIK